MPAGQWRAASGPREVDRVEQPSRAFSRSPLSRRTPFGATSNSVRRPRDAAARSRPAPRPPAPAARSAPRRPRPDLSTASAISRRAPRRASSFASSSARHSAARSSSSGAGPAARSCTWRGANSFSRASAPRRDSSRVRNASGGVVGHRRSSASRTARVVGRGRRPAARARPRIAAAAPDASSAPPGSPPRASSSPAVSPAGRQDRGAGLRPSAPAGSAAPPRPCCPGCAAAAAAAEQLAPQPRDLVAVMAADRRVGDRLQRRAQVAVERRAPLGAVEDSRPSVSRRHSSVTIGCAAVDQPPHRRAPPRPGSGRRGPAPRAAGRSAATCPASSSGSARSITPHRRAQARRVAVERDHRLGRDPPEQRAADPR